MKYSLYFYLEQYIFLECVDAYFYMQIMHNVYIYFNFHVFI